MVVKAAQLQSESESESGDEDSEAERSADKNALWRNGRNYCYAVQQVEQSEHFFGICYNCKDPGHRWYQCTLPLRPELSEIKD